MKEEKLKETEKNLKEDKKGDVENRDDESEYMLKKRTMLKKEKK